MDTTKIEDRRAGASALAGRAMLGLLLGLLWVPATAEARRPVGTPLVHECFGTQARAVVRGRVVRRPIGAGGPRDSVLKRVVRSLRLLGQRGLKHRTVRIEVGGQTHRVNTDGRGHFALQLPQNGLKIGRHAVRVTFPGGAVGDGTLRIWPQKAGVVVVSDIDDTLLATGVNRKLRMGLRFLTGTAHRLKANPGAVDFYQRLQDRPLVFVSSSPTFLQGRLRSFFRLRRLPSAPMLLRSGPRQANHQHKLQKIERILALFPGYQLYLVGDSGQHDPELFRHAVTRWPQRIQGVAIRQTRRSERQSDPRFAGQLLFSDFKAVERALKKRL